MSKAIDYINVAIVGDFERGYYVSKDDAIKEVEFERKETVNKLFNELKRILPKYVFLSFDGILTMDWDKLHREFTECANKTMEE